LSKSACSFFCSLGGVRAEHLFGEAVEAPGKHVRVERRRSRARSGTRRGLADRGAALDADAFALVLELSGVAGGAGEAGDLRPERSPVWGSVTISCVKPTGRPSGLPELGVLREGSRSLQGSWGQRSGRRCRSLSFGCSSARNQLVGHQISAPWPAWWNHCTLLRRPVLAGVSDLHRREGGQVRTGAVEQHLDVSAAGERGGGYCEKGQSSDRVQIIPRRYGQGRAFSVTRNVTRPCRVAIFSRGLSAQCRWFGA
jgi:hypothetical protein